MFFKDLLRKEIQEQLLRGTFFFGKASSLPAFGLIFLIHPSPLGSFSVAGGHLSG